MLNFHRRAAATAARLFTLIAAALFGPLPFAHGADDLTTDELVAHLKAVEANIDRGMTTTVRTSEFYGKGRDAPAPGDLENPECFVQETTVETTLFRHNCRFERSYDRTNPNLESLQGNREIRMWDGEQARLFLIAKDSLGRLHQGGDIASEPHVGLILGSHWSFHGRWVLQSKDGYRFSDLFAGREVIGPVRLANGNSQWRIPLRDKYMEYIVEAARVETDVRLVAVEDQHYSWEVGHEYERLLCGSRIEFSGDGGGLLFGDKSTTTMRHYRAKPEEAFWGVGVVELVSIRALDQPPPPGHFRVGFPMGAEVSDSRFNFAYTVGGDHINVDGRILVTHEPVHGEVGENLAMWVQRGRWHDDPAAKKASPPASPASPPQQHGEK